MPINMVNSAIQTEEEKISLIRYRSGLGFFLPVTPNIDREGAGNVRTELHTDPHRHHLKQFNG
jgi:hypothetical protein